mgnify:CR=1 FL=1
MNPGIGSFATKEELLAQSDKTCTKCGVVKARSEFSCRVKKGRWHSHSECKTCANLQKRLWYAKNTEYARAHARNYHWVNRENILNKKTKYNSSHREELRKEARDSYWEKPEVFKARSREFHKANRETALVKMRSSHLKRLYGMSEAEYQNKFEEQSGLCYICKKPETRKMPNGQLCRLSVDHDHATGLVRDLLCAACNIVVGLVFEDIVIAESVADYIRKWKGRADGN